MSFLSQARSGEYVLGWEVKKDVDLCERLTEAQGFVGLTGSVGFVLLAQGEQPPTLIH